MVENVPIWKEDIAIGPYGQGGTARGGCISALPGVPVSGSSLAAPPAPPPEELEAHDIPEIPLEDPGDDDDDDDQGIRFRSMSKQALEVEMASAAHRATHFPHNPLCPMCIKAHMR